MPDDGDPKIIDEKKLSLWYLLTHLRIGALIGTIAGIIGALTAVFNWGVSIGTNSVEVPAPPEILSLRANPSPNLANIEILGTYRDGTKRLGSIAVEEFSLSASRLYTPNERIEEVLSVRPRFISTASQRVTNAQIESDDEYHFWPNNREPKRNSERARRIPFFITLDAYVDNETSFTVHPRLPYSTEGIIQFDITDRDARGFIINEVTAGVTTYRYFIIAVVEAIHVTNDRTGNLPRGEWFSRFAVFEVCVDGCSE